MDDISLGLYPGLRLCPLDLTTNHGLLRCPSLYCGTSLESPFLISLLFSGLLLTVCKCGFDTMVPVERAKWMTSAWDCTLGYGCVHWTSRPTMDCSGVHLFTVELLWSFSGQFFTSCCHLPPHPPTHILPPTHPPTHPPPQYAGPKLVHTFKNDLK